MKFDAQLKWSVSHDPCRVGDRAPLGAVAAGTSVRVLLRVDEAVRAQVASVDVLVCERGVEGGEDPWRCAALAPCAEGFEGALELADFPHVAFYVFALHLADGTLAYYVPRADGRSTAGEVVAEDVDGAWTQAGWAFAQERLAERPMGDFGLAGLLPGFQVTVFQPGFQAPAWMEGAVMYQIFPDRFAQGAGGVRKEGLAYHERMGRPVRLHRSWDEPPEWKAPAEKGAVAGKGPDNVEGAAANEGVVGKGAAAGEDASPGPSEDASGIEAQMAAYDPIDFYGGTLAGIREKLPYLASLGVGVLYLNPVFEARSNHRYDTADYERIDPLLGDEAEFARLAREARDLGISIVLDAVLSHTGDDSRYFNARGAYAGAGAAQGDESPFRSWYDFSPQPDGLPYRSWWGFASLPEVDERDPSWQEYMFGQATGEVACDGSGHASEGVLPMWLHAGARGYRIDVADEIPDDVLARLRACVKGADSQAAIIGEVWEDATTKESYGAARTYALGNSLDSVMNYPLRDALLGFVLGQIDAWQLAAFLKAQQANYPRPLHRSLMNLLSTHDVERVRSVLALGGSVKHLRRDEQLKVVNGITGAQDRRAAQLQRLAAGLLYALPGMPCIYYGDERGLQGGGDPFCRATFPWGDASGEWSRRADCGEDLTAFYRRIGTMRKGSEALTRGEFACKAAGADALVLLRVNADGAAGEDGPDDEVAQGESGEAVLAAVNRSEKPVTFAFDACDPHAALSLQAQSLVRQQLTGAWRPVFNSEAADPNAIAAAECEDGIIRATMPAKTACYWR